VDPTRSAALGGPRERRFVGPAAGPHGAQSRSVGHMGHPSAHSPRAPCSSPTGALAWPKPDLSPPTDFDGDGILALFALAAGACREPPRAPCSSSTDAPAWPRSDLSPPTDFDGDSILALFALAAGRFVGSAGGGGLTVDPTRSAALGGPRERRFVGPAAGPHGGAIAPRPRVRPAHPLLTRLLGPNLISLPRQMLTATASLRSSRLQQAPAENLPVRPAHPLPDLSPPTDFDGGGILALFALAAGACREGTSGGVPCLTGDSTDGACREGKGGKVLLPRRGGGVAGVGRGESGGGATQARRG
jgi:hypothetical protein